MRSPTAFLLVALATSVPASAAPKADPRQAVLTKAEQAFARQIQISRITPTVGLMLAAARADFETRTGGRPYRSPIPPGQKPPAP
jgi:hypothetical protein